MTRSGDAVRDRTETQDLKLGRGPITITLEPEEVDLVTQCISRFPFKADYEFMRHVAPIIERVLAKCSQAPR